MQDEVEDALGFYPAGPMTQGKTVSQPISPQSAFCNSERGQLQSQLDRQGRVDGGDERAVLTQDQTDDDTKDDVGDMLGPALLQHCHERSRVSTDDGQL